MSFRRGIKVLPLRALLQQTVPLQEAHPFSRGIYRIFPSKNIV